MVFPFIWKLRKRDVFPLWDGSAALAAYSFASPPPCAMPLSSKPDRVERAERSEASQSLPVSSPAHYLPTQVSGGEVCWWGGQGRGLLWVEFVCFGEGSFRDCEGTSRLYYNNIYVRLWMYMIMNLSCVFLWELAVGRSWVSHFSVCVCVCGGFVREATKMKLSRWLWYIYIWSCLHENSKS